MKKASLKSEIFLYVAILSAFVFLTHCTNPNPETYKKIAFDQFNDNYQLFAEEFSIPIHLNSVNNIFVVDTFLIISQKKSDSILTIFSLPTIELVKSFGSVGRGPDEFLNHSPSMTLGPVYNEKPSFAVNNNRTHVRYYNIFDLIENNFKPYRTLKLPPSIKSFQSICYLSDTLIFGSPFGGNMFLFKFNIITNKLDKCQDYPIELSNIDDWNRTNIFAGRITLKPDNTKFAFTFIKEGKLELYDSAGNLTRRIEYEDTPSIYESIGVSNSIKDLSQMGGPEKWWMYSWEVKASKRHIYIKVYACNHSEIYSGEAYQLNRAITPKIHVFDWNGNPVRSLSLEKYYSYFAVDLEDLFIYATDDEYPSIITRYRIK